MEETKKRPGRPKKAVVNDNVKDTTTTTVETVKKPKERLVMKDTDEVVVRSNVFGELIYINDRTGDQINWENYEEEQVMSAKDIRDMKARQQSFFKEGWISIVDSPDVDFDEYTMKEVYNALQIGRYYNDSLVSFNMDDIFTMSEDARGKKVSTMSESVKRSAIIRANDKIKDGSLDSIKKVKLLEEVLGCELTSPED